MWETWIRSLVGKIPGEGKGYPLQYSGLEKSLGSQRVRHNWETFTFQGQRKNWQILWYKYSNKKEVRGPDLGRTNLKSIQVKGRSGNSDRLYFFELQNQMVIAAMKLKDTCSLEEKLWPTQTTYQKAKMLLCQRSPSSQSYGFSSSHVWMWELDYKESWTLKNWCFWTVVLEKTLESPLAYKKIQPVHPKGNQSWIFIGRTDVEAETPIFWPPDAKNWLIWKDSDARKDWRQEEKGMTEDEMVGWHHRLNGHEFE